MFYCCFYGFFFFRFVLFLFSLAARKLGREQNCQPLSIQNPKKYSCALYRDGGKNTD